jgi:Tol biopolymer transport system component
VAEVPPPNPFVPIPLFAWLPNGKWVVTDGLVLLSTQSGETRRLTSPPSLFDVSPAVSPDGRTVAFSRIASGQNSNIYLLDLTEDLKPKRELRRLTFAKRRDSLSPAWTPNGREIIFASGSLGGGISLWKVPASGAWEPEQLTFNTGEEAYWPAISPSNIRLGLPTGGVRGEYVASFSVGPGSGQRIPNSVQCLYTLGRRCSVFSRRQTDCL